MSQAVVAEPASATSVQYVPILYDPARRRRRARRRKKADPAPVAVIADPRRRRRRAKKYDPIRVGKIGVKGMIDSAVDGLGFAYIANRVPATFSLGPMNAQDLVAIGGSFAYEYLYMKRGFLGGAIAAAVAYFARRWMG